VTFPAESGILRRTERLAPLPSGLSALAAARPYSILLQTARFDRENRRSYLCLAPIQTLAAHSLDELPALFAALDRALARGHYAAGYLDYECGYHFEHFPHLTLPPAHHPIAWFGVYDSPHVFDHATGRFLTAPPPTLPPTAPEPAPTLDDLTLSLDEPAYSALVRRIQQLIAAGDTYQANLTLTAAARTTASAATLYEHLLRAQPVSYAALLNIPGRHILSFSPELFFRIENDRITARPMKGTMPRGLDAREDESLALRLQRDPKNRAEHVMILDLLRNDLGRLCRMGSVRPADSFSIERYPTLLQMTSTVTGELRPSLRPYNIFRALFPCGSITGAPKLRTMQILRELEPAPRAIGTGAIGLLSPNGDAIFSVAIRTLTLSPHGELALRVGGGIVADSDPQAEFRECQLKTSFLTRSTPTFQLIETTLCDQNRIALLPLHLNRLAASADYFDFACDRSRITVQIEKEIAALPSTPHRIRLLLSASGEISFAATPHTPGDSARPIRVLLAATRTQSTDPFLRHKTTHRALYESELARARTAGFDEVLFQNESGELTEGCISNLFIRIGDELLTPPLAAGVLPGVLRAHILATDASAREQTLTLHDLARASAVYLGNALRGLRPAQINPQTTPRA
jgi:para-aminobenzoate synthetase/4-amino-4-deoxychorismate lyase